VRARGYQPLVERFTSAELVPASAAE
jgi:hypothetical protein